MKSTAKILMAFLVLVGLHQRRVPAAHAQASSASYRILAETLNTGGGSATSASFALFGCLAPAPDGGGVSASTSFRLGTGCAEIAAPRAGCGNGVVELPEACDDGDVDANDGCSASCGIEAGWTCSGSPSACLLLTTSTPTMTATSTPTSTPTRTPTFTPTVSCVGAPMGMDCNDGLACNGSDSCDGAGSCAVHSGSPCDDADPCTQDTCAEPGACENEVVVESRACGTCLDEADNDSDGDLDADDSGCATLSEAQPFAIVGRAATGKSILFGSQVLVDAIDGGTVDSLAPFPVGPSHASVCGEANIALLSAVQIRGSLVGAANQKIKLGSGSDSNIGDYFADTPTTARILTGAPPVVGPGTCTGDASACHLDHDCAPPASTCEGLFLDDPGNPYVDHLGTHTELLRCTRAKAALLADATYLFGLPAQVVPAIQLKQGDAQPLPVLSGPGPHILRTSAVRLSGNGVLTVAADDPDALVVIQVEKGLAVGKQARVEIGGQLKAENLLWVAAGKGSVKILGSASFAGTVLAPERTIKLGQGVTVAGSLLGNKVAIKGTSTVLHHPFTALF